MEQGGFKYGSYTWEGPYSYGFDNVSNPDESYVDMLSEHDRHNLLSDMSVEDFVRTTWVVPVSSDPGEIWTTPVNEGDDAEFFEFWRRVKAFENNRPS
jgi:hypothetical protein